MAKGRRHGEWLSHHGRGWNTTRWPSFACVGERVLALRLGSVVRTAFQEELPKMGRADQVRRRLCATEAEGEIDVEDRTQRMLAASEMEVGPPKPLCRERLQTTARCVGQEPRW